MKASEMTLRDYFAGLALPKIGKYWPEQGGIYFGVIEEEGKLYALIVARKEDGENTEVNWSEANEFCRNLRIGGLEDWVIPNRYDLMQTFKNNTDDCGEFGNMWYWSSTEFNAVSAWFQGLGNGYQGLNYKADTGSVRAVRKALI